MKYVIGIDMGATNIRVGVINENLEIVEVIRESTSHGGNDSLIQQIVRLIKQVHYEKYNISSITIGVPGRVRNDGYVYELPNIHVSDIDFVTTLQNVFHVPTFVINDAVAAGLAEAISGMVKITLPFSLLRFLVESVVVSLLIKNLSYLLQKLVIPYLNTKMAIMN